MNRSRTRRTTFASTAAAVALALIFAAAAFAQEDEVAVFDDSTPMQQSPAAQTPATTPPPAAPSAPSDSMIAAPWTETPKFEEPPAEKAPAPIEIAEEDPLPSPTAHLEAYERERLKRLYKRNTPKASINLMIAPRAFSKTDWRLKSGTQLPAGRLPSQQQPQMKGVLVGYEKMIGRKLGIWSIGINGGIYGASDTDGYTKIMTALFSLEPYFQYSFSYLDQQWFAPYFKIGLENVYQNFTYEGAKTNAFSRLARADGGIQIYLNFLERMQAGEMRASYGVKRTYLVGCMTYAKDLGVQNVDLNETSWRAGFRFEY